MVADKTYRMEDLGSFDNDIFVLQEEKEYFSDNDWRGGRDDDSEASESSATLTPGGEAK